MVSPEPLSVPAFRSDHVVPQQCRGELIHVYAPGQSQGAEETFSSGGDPVPHDPAHSLAVPLVVCFYPEAADPPAQVIGWQPSLLHPQHGPGCLFFLVALSAALEKETGETPLQTKLQAEGRLANL